MHASLLALPVLVADCMLSRVFEAAAVDVNCYLPGFKLAGIAWARVVWKLQSELESDVGPLPLAIA